MAECKITVVRKKGPETGPVSSFVKDDEVLYRAVWGHLRGCKKCDVNKIMRLYLANRDGKKKRGLTTKTLSDYVFRHARTSFDIDQELVKQFVLRCPDIRVTIDQQNLLTIEEVIRTFALCQHEWLNETGDQQAPEESGFPIHVKNSTKAWSKIGANKWEWVFMGLATLAMTKVVPLEPNEQEMGNLISTAEMARVMEP